MKLNKNSNKYQIRIPIVLFVFLIVALITVTSYLVYTISTNETTTNKTIDKVIDNKNKQDYIDTQNNNTDTPIDQAKNEDISLSAKIESNGNVTIATQIKNVSDGTCELTITNNTSYSKTATLIYQNEYSICAGFNIPKDDIADGVWDIKLDVTPINGDKLTNNIKFEVNR